MLKIIESVFVKNYASIQGRANRTEYWGWALFMFVVQMLVIVSATVSLVAYFSLTGIVCVVTFLPGICVVVRRLHDTGRGGGWFFISFVPIVGAIWLLILMLLPSEHQPNRFGDEPTMSL